MRQIIIIVLSLFSLIGFGQEDDLYLNYLASARNDSTSPSFLVITLKNLNTNETREICITANQLINAIRFENNFDHSQLSYEKTYQIIEENKQRYFEFGNIQALQNLSVTYSQLELEKYKAKINFKRLARDAKRNKSWKKKLEFEEIIIYAHHLFNEGVITIINGCAFDGAIHVIDRKDLN